MGFSTGLCSCTQDTSGCCDIICCAPCQIGRQCNAIDDQVNTGHCLYCCLAMIGPFATIMAACIRCKVVDKFMLGEAKPISCILGLLCATCSLCQTHRELTLQNKWPGGACCQSKPFNMA